MPDDRDADARARVGRAVRLLGHAVVGRQAEPELLDRIAATLEQFSAELGAGGPRRRATESFGATSWTAELPQGIIGSYDDRPFSGRSSPWGLDLEVHRRGDEIEGLCTLGAAHEGAPGQSHGGIVAGLFDDVFGFVLGILREPAFTGELFVRYERPTPLHRPLACRGRLVKRHGRKIWIEGELVDLTADRTGDGAVVARGRGLFISVDRASMAPTAERDLSA